MVVLPEQLKKDYMDNITDTLDLVPIAAWHGQGKRTGTFGAFLLACYDDEGDSFQSICKVRGGGGGGGSRGGARGPHGHAA